MKFVPEHVVYRVAQAGAFHQRRIEASDGEIGLGHRQLYVSDHVGEQRKFLSHLSQLLFLLGAACSVLLQGMADAKPSRNGMTALHPAKHPGDRAKVFQLSALAAASRT